MTSDVDVVVVGAGVAGLSAAASLRRAGLDCIVLEASGRIGGRARTVEVAGNPVDLGASWLHDTEHNPLADIAREHGDILTISERRRDRRKFIDGRPATAAELDDFDATWELFSEVASARAVSGEDVSLAEAIETLRGHAWTATVEYWEGCLIAAADPRRFSVRDWHLNLLEGSNLDVRGGVGAFVTRRLGPLAGTISLETPATRVEWGGPRRRVRIETPRGAIAADACIVTVSTGVLAAGGIAFEPALPASVQTAIAELPMGLLAKICLPVIAPERLGLIDPTHLQRRVRDATEPAMNFLCLPFGRPHVVGFSGGPGAWALAREGRAAIEDFARSELASMLGWEAATAVGPLVMADWAGDPSYRGAYCFATVGHVAARKTLSEPVGDGRLVFAGEATRTDGLAGTVGGAYLSGASAAAGIIAMLAPSLPE